LLLQITGQFLFLTALAKLQPDLQGVTDRSLLQNHGKGVFPEKDCLPLFQNCLPVPVR
jgi:hypothetical protein